jgi:hypothetical protein
MDLSLNLKRVKDISYNSDTNILHSKPSFRFNCIGCLATGGRRCANRAAANRPSEMGHVVLSRFGTSSSHSAPSNPESESPRARHANTDPPCRESTIRPLPTDRSKPERKTGTASAKVAPMRRRSAAGSDRARRGAAGVSANGVAASFVFLSLDGGTVWYPRVGLDFALPERARAYLFT